MFSPRWEELLDPMVWIWAMGQAFFSLSITGSGMIVYGAYLRPEEDVVSLAKQTALFDTIAALVAALVIIPACFAYGLDVGAGPSSPWAGSSPSFCIPPWSSPGSAPFKICSRRWESPCCTGSPD